MNSLISLFLMSSSSSPIPDDLLRADGFALQQVDSRMAMLPSQISKHAEKACIRARKPNNETLLVKSAWIPETKTGRILPFEFDSEAYRKMTSFDSSVPPRALQLPSGAPAGEARIYGGTMSTRSTGSIRVCCDTPWAMVQVQWGSPMVKSDRGHSEIAPHDAVAKEAFVERIARHTLTNAAGMRSESAGNGNLAGHGVGRARRRGTAFFLGDVSQWSASAGWTITEEDEFGLLHLRKGSKWAVLPLGADQIKVNGVWKEMGDSAAFMNGKLYLPEGGLRHLRDAS